MSTVGSASQPWKGPIYPATIKQLLRASQPHSQSKFYVDDIELGVVTCVAGIVATSDHGSMTAYYLEDGSAGRLRTTWSRESETSEQFETHTYVRVVGHLDAYNNITTLKATHIRPVLDMHEPFFHFLEAMVALISKQKSSAPPPARIAIGAEAPQSPLVMQRRFEDIDGLAVGPGVQEPTSQDASAAIVREFDELTLVSDTAYLSDESTELESPQISWHTPLPSLPSSPMSGDDALATDHRPSLRQDPYSALTALQRDIVLQIQNNCVSYPDGVPIRVVFRRTISPRFRVNESEIRQEIDKLMEDGLIYSTIDQYHFKLVD
ncbi:hypothetical protein EDB83DRAFT_1280915 [Lactarius deliciosus]|nr:hypothetical protein EDB83DRAFT_1280915 [Lactarius deliciosus]